jgi:hypothetical protein
MGQVAINSFNKGMTQDMGKSIPQQGSYLYGKNLRIIANEDSAESGIVVNVEGNSFSISFIVPQSTLSPCQAAWVENGSLEFYEGIVVPIGGFVSYSGVIYYNFNHNGPLLETHITSEEGMRVIECGNTAGDGEFPFEYLEGYGDPSIESNTVPTDVELAALNGEVPVDIIGWATVRDTIYVFATNSSSLNPGGILEEANNNPSSYGYIYKVEFDLVLNTADSELVYYDSELNFSTAHPIEAVGRYETDSIQRLYWTDNFNPPRTINIADPNVLSLNPDDLNINPSITFSRPSITTVSDGGSLPSGMYQYAYRLRNIGTEGAVTRFSPLSGLVHVVEASEGEDYWTYSSDPEITTEYVGNEPGVMCQKAVTIQIDNIDLDYEYIEVAAIFRTTKEGVSNSYIFTSKKLTSSSITVKHSSNIDIVGLVSITELTSHTLRVERAKTLEAKDNRLFLGNVITPTDTVNINARAYRYKRDDNKVYVGDISPATTYSDINFDPTEEYVQDADLYASAGFTYGVEHNLDALNPYNADIVDSITDATKSYKYQEDGRTIGGEGPYVKYEFIKKELDGDEYVTGSARRTAPFVSVAATQSDCNTGTSYFDYKNPVTNANLKGYQRDEIYRFGLVLFDLQGNPGDVNWIGDIRFPTHRDIDYKGGASLYNFTLSQTRETGTGDNYHYSGSQSGMNFGMDADGVTNLQSGGQFGALSSSSSSGGKNTGINKHSMYALGIKFDVTLPEDIQKQVSGWSIVRVERKTEDRTTLGQGLGTWMSRFAEQDDQGGTTLLAFNAHLASQSDGSNFVVDNYGQMRHTLMTMDSPDFALTGNYPTAGDCDWIEVLGEMGTGASRNSYENDFVDDTDDNFYRKYYSHVITYRDLTAGSTLNRNFFKPDNSSVLSEGGTLGSGLIPDGDEFFKDGIFNAGVETTVNDIDFFSIGCETLFLVFPGYHVGGNPSAGYYVGNVPSTGVATAFPYYEHWLLATEGAETEDLLNHIYFHNGDDELYEGASGTDASLSANDDEPHINSASKFKTQEKPLLSWRRERPSQYGGRTHQDRTTNIYIAASEFVPVVKLGANNYSPAPSIDVWGGDTYIHYYDFVKLKKWSSGDIGSNDTIKKFNFNFAFPVETTLNIGMREGSHFANSDDLDFDDTTIRDLYSAENDLIEFYPKNPEIYTNGQYDNRVLYSDEKISGQLKDSWRSFRYDNYRDVDGGYGPINKLTLFRDSLYSFQDRGVGLFAVNPVAITTTQESDSIVLGTGAVIQDHKYIITDVGSKHQWSVLATNKGLYWADILTNSIYKMGGAEEGMLEVSRVKGLKSFFEDRLEYSPFSLTEYNNLTGSVMQFGDTPTHLHGIVAGYDAKNNEVLFSFLERGNGGTIDHGGTPDKKETICYSETTQSFTSFYDFATPMFINTQDKLLSVDPSSGNSLYLHNTGAYGQWYNETFKTILRFIVNPNPTETKVFDNFEWHTEVLNAGGDIPNQTWTNIAVQTDYQNSANVLYPDINIKRRERTWKTAVARDKGVSRLRDKYLIVQLEYENNGTGGNKIRSHYVKTKFRVSKR